jgi:pantoate--beta-alanine ligase
MQAVSRGEKKRGRRIGLVPTMGALHDGHASLIRACRKHNDVSVVSIFVNPIQFGPGEDLKKYPRTLRADLALCRKIGVDFVFAPSAGEMYPAGFLTFVEVRRLGDGLCGVSRPGHFRGVTTVVAKLFNAVLPEKAYFGRKDAQQAAIIRRMTADLNFPVSIEVMPIVREKDGLAISSRNRYLSAGERADALVLHGALRLGRKMISSGCVQASKVISAMERYVSAVKSASIDYISIVDAGTLEPVYRLSGRCLIALAVKIGTTRLIDNCEVVVRR